MAAAFMPVCREDLEARGIDQLDFVYINGDAYVDHPTFGVAIITRVLEHAGFTVGVLAQPDWHRPESFLALGKPRYAFLVSAGNIDSMVAHYTVAKNRRKTDAYTAGNVAGKRPDRAVTVYSRCLKQAAPEVPVLIGGLEASLRRFAHYDYWDDTVHPSVLEESGADLLMFGMGELEILEIANRFREGQTVQEMTDIRGTCYLCDPKDTPIGSVECPSYALVSTDKKSYAKAVRRQMDEQDEVTGRRMIQRQKEKMLVQNPPMRSMTQEELDEVYALPYARTYHPMYEKEGGVKAIEEVEFSITHNRGCFGGCNFCAITLHQGRHITCRSEESVVEEARLLTKNPHFKGYIHDVGGPTADFRLPSCAKQDKYGMCKGDKKCLAPTPCKALQVDHSEYLHMLRRLRELPGVKKVFIRSGIRYDYLLADPDESFFDELVQYHVSGHLKVAPEHVSDAVLDKMGKPHMEVYQEFVRKFYAKTKKAGKEQYLVPYLISSHPGSTINDAIELALFLKKEHVHPEQVQDFYPTPGTVSTCMYYTELDPYTLEPVYVPKTREEKQMQRALLQYFSPANRDLVLRALKKARRYDLIGTGPNCLVRDVPHPSHGKDEDKGGRAWQQNRKGGKKTPGPRGKKAVKRKPSSGR
jgi:uncharacterized radical SAM protein YgiQ